MSKATPRRELLEQRHLQALRRLEADGIISRGNDGQTRTTRRWQAAVMRAVTTLMRSGDGEKDVRAPIALALVDLYRGKADDIELCELVMAMVEVEGEMMTRSSPLFSGSVSGAQSAKTHIQTRYQ